MKRAEQVAGGRPSTHEALDRVLQRLNASQPLPSSPVTPPSRRGATIADARPARMVGPGVDWAEVVVLRRRAAEQMTEAFTAWEAEHKRTLGPEDRRMLGRSVISQVVRARGEELAASAAALWSPDDEADYRVAVDSAIFGYGRMQPVFEIADAENIEIHGWDSVVVQHTDGRRSEHPPVADSDEELVEAVRFLGETAQPARPFDDAHPMMTIALGTRFRLHAIGFGLSFRPSVIIRQHLHTDVTLASLAAGGLMPLELARILRAGVLAQKSTVVSGDQGAGKTTLLRALIDAIPRTERFGTLETDYELLTHLQPHRRNMLALQARVGLGEQAAGHSLGAWSVADLIPEALRQNLTRLVVGEVRGEEAGALFQAMQSGAGSLSTTHSHSAVSTIDRLASRVAQGGVISVDEAYRQIAHNLHFLVHVKLVDDTWRGGTRSRFISEVRTLTGGLENGRPTTHLLYRAGSAGQPEVLHPEPALLDELAPFLQEQR
ncbi:type II/IV secretion system ATPase subunit [Tessaracoccus sp. SD287]|uniref:CpaF family protein n=1 Tax=Tessaracoccus sp. SD287 TaxID=2782008 RepID=UPI001A957B77|nr:CpaF/VirB11 family protein [Tessaracoccus sp. SD287]MBO1031199.1 type II/IV secretion system ATPase subunit [Tessaracoccus sp. SD287]